MLHLLLKHRGFKSIDLCADGKEAVDCVSAKDYDHYDIIFLDNLMPVMNGPETVSILRKNGFNKLIIGLTGNALDTDVLEFELSGADIVLVKPLKIDLFDKLFQYIYVYGVKSDSYKDHQHHHGDVDDGNILTLKEFLSS